MNPDEPRLQRLLEAAAQAPRPIGVLPPFGFETRVLAGVRSQMAERNGDTSLLVFLHRALLCSCAIMGLSVMFYYRTLSAPASTEADLAYSAIEQTLP